MPFKVHSACSVPTVHFARQGNYAVIIFQASLYHSPKTVRSFTPRRKCCLIRWTTSYEVLAFIICFSLSPLEPVQVITTIPNWVIPKCGRKTVKGRRVTLSIAGDVIGPETAGLMASEISTGPPLADGGVSGHRPSTGFVAKAANVVARSLGAIYPQPEVEEEDEEEDEDREHLANAELKNTGQILWIRGLSRLQTQVSMDS